jgi:His/Glu/Gln/Arg/opine family amino acid ABC transporter permease subunit
MNYTFHWNTVWNVKEALLKGALVTLELTITSMLLGAFIGVFIAFGKNSSRRLFVNISSSWIEVARNTPCLFQIYMIYFGLGQFGINVSSYLSVLIALTFNNAGYLAEIIRGGLKSIPATQMTAARSLGMKISNVYIYVILPQVFKVVYYPSTNQMMWALLNSSLGMVVGLSSDIAGVTSFEQARTFRAFEFFTAAAILYYAIAKLIMFLSKTLGKKIYGTD